ncbi:MAG: hypothetical protein H6R45_624 [Proteobacteria bacterium]|nr:hypothetical protein [Pseudomonadota bacterium]
MAGERDAAVETVVAGLQHYLAAHPEAADTLENIGDWWFTACGSGIDKETVALALERLIEAGRLSKERLADGRVLFRAVKRNGA